jgi:hypothetical protein
MESSPNIHRSSDVSGKDPDIERQSMGHDIERQSMGHDIERGMGHDM